MIDDVYTATAALLASVAPSYFGQQYTMQTDVPPRYVWIPERMSLGGPRAIGMNPTMLHTAQCVVSVHIWGATYAATELLIRQLMTAVRRVVLGANYRVVSIDIAPAENLTAGYLARVELELALNFFEASLTGGADGLSTATVTTEAFENVPGASGDGILNVKEG